MAYEMSLDENLRDRFVRFLPAWQVVEVLKVKYLSVLNVVYTFYGLKLYENLK